MTNIGETGAPERSENSLPPELSLTDHQHVHVYAEFCAALTTRLTLDDVDMRVTLAAVLQDTIRPSNGDYSEVQDAIERWADQFSFDTTSTRYGDRSTDVISRDEEDGGTSLSDPDGSGRRSANKKRAAALYEVALHLAVHPDSVVSSVARGAIVRLAVSQTVVRFGSSIDVVRPRLKADLMHYADLYAEVGDLDNQMLVLGAARYAEMISTEAELAHLRVNTTTENY